MKRSLLTALLAGAALAAGAQTDKKMTKEEKEATLQTLELVYRMETGQTLQELVALGKKEYEVATLPWDKWKKKYEGNPEVALVLRALEQPALEPVPDQEQACRICFRSLGPDSDDFSATASTSWDDNYYTDAQGHRTGFHLQMPLLCDLNAEFRFHLTTESGQPMYLAEDDSPGYQKRQRPTTEGQAEYTFGVKFPLSSPYMYVDGGYVDVALYAPDDYEHVAIPLDRTGQTVSLNGVSFTLAKADTVSFVIQADEEDVKKLKAMKYIYKQGDTYRTSFPTTLSGALDELLSLGSKPVPAFDAWLAQKGVDKDRLEETLDNFEKSYEEEEGQEKPYGQLFHTGLTGDSLLLYMPTDSVRRRPVATLRLFASALRKAPEVSVDKELADALLARIYPEGPAFTARPATPQVQPEAPSDDMPREETEEISLPPSFATDKPDYLASALTKVEYPDTPGAPGQIKPDARLTPEEEDALLASNGQISYGVGVVQADRLARDARLQDRHHLLSDPDTLTHFILGFSQGIQTAQAIYREAEHRAGDQADTLYAPQAQVEDIYRTIREETEWAMAAGLADGLGYTFGTEAFQLYRTSAARDLLSVNPTTAIGHDLDVIQAIDGFTDCLQRRLKMGLSYASSLLSRRKAAICDLNDRPPFSEFTPAPTGNLPDVQLPQGVDPSTGHPIPLHTAVVKEVRMPREAAEMGASGRVELEVTVEADGCIKDVRILHCPYPGLGEAAADAVYRTRCFPARIGDQAVAVKLTIPVLFLEAL